MLDVTACLIVVVFFLIMGYTPDYLNNKRRVKRIPGPISFPLLGTRWVFSVGGFKMNKIHEFYKEMHEIYGPIMKEETVFNFPLINVFEKGDIEKVFRGAGKYPLRPPTEAIAQYRRSVPERYSSAGLTNEQGEKWHYLRTSLTTALTSPKTISGFLPQINEIADDWCHLLKQKRSETGRITGLEELAGRLGLETICALVLGRRMGFLLEDRECTTARKLADAVHANFVACRDTHFGLPLWKIVNTPSYKRLAQSERSVYELVTELIKTADDSTKESAVFQSVINADVDPKEKTAAIVDFIAAGIHTLKNSFLFLLYQVAMYRDAQREILQDHTKTYLKACSMETFRVTPTVGSLARILERDMELSGHMVKAGSMVLCHTGIACSSDANFKDARKFRPERWINADEKSETSSSAAFIVTPFGYGRRICPGKRFIEQVIPVMLEKTLERFEVAAEDELELEFEFLLSPKGPVCMTFRDRN